MIKNSAKGGDIILDQYEVFELCRDLVRGRLKELITFYFDKQYDPLEKKFIIEGIESILKKEQDSLGFMAILPKTLYPKFKIRIREEDMVIEYMVQQYLNDEDRLIFLGTCKVTDDTCDLYIGKSFGFMSPYRIVARHGNKKEDKRVDETQQAEKQHEMGLETPFSIAYTLACADGLISES